MTAGRCRRLAGPGALPAALTFAQAAAVPISALAALQGLRDVGAVHTKLARGFVTDVRMDGADRIVTFANGMEARERIVDVDDAARRVAWAVVGSAMTHHNASAQVFPVDEQRSRLVWIADLLPDELAGDIRQMMEHGATAMKKALNRR